MPPSQESILALLKQASDTTSSCLPLGGSLIAYQLLLNLYASQQRGEEPIVKALFASIPYSDMGIRYHLRKLLDDGWVELKQSTHDKRTRICATTPKLDAVWASVLQKIGDELDDKWVCSRCAGNLNGDRLGGS